MREKFLMFLILPFLLTFTSGCKDESVQNIKKDKELQQLNVLFQEIETMGNQVSCENAADWKFVLVGTDFCSAGKSTYIAYSTKIDQSLFLQKVFIYKEKQKAFSAKWERQSACPAVIMAEPKGVECVNGKPKLVY